MWCGVMRSHGFQVIPVEPRRWKRDMKLTGKDKESSRQLALQLFPGMTDMMKRRKDHGRAEALLICTWAIVVGGSRDPQS